MRTDDAGARADSRSLRYMPALDGLRAIAVGLVFVTHALPSAPFPGGLGVDIFFVISGYLITRILLAELDRSGQVDLKAFYIKRALRLYPALLFMAMTFLTLFFLLRRGVPVTEIETTAIALAYLSNIWMTFTGDYLGHVTHTWSLAMEEQFYLIWPLVLLILVRLLSRRRAIAVLAAMALVSLTGWGLTGNDYPYHPLTRTGGLLIGCVVAFLVERRPWQSPVLAQVALVLFGTLVLAEYAHWATREFTLPAVSLILPFIILHASFGDGWMVRALSVRPLVHLGARSYGIYLWHYPILSALTSLGVVGPTGLLVACAMTYLTAATSFRWVELPVLRFKNRLGQH